MSNIIKQPKPQAKRIDPKLKSKILNKILLPDASIPKIAKEYNLSSTTLYGWRIDHIKKLTFDLKNNQGLSKTSENNFIELVSEDDLVQKEGPISPKVPSISEVKNNSKLSEISLLFNNNISLSLKGNINSSSLIKIINCLEDQSC